MADSHPSTTSCNSKNDKNENNNNNMNQTLLQLNDYKLPVEITNHIISFFVPEAGLCISNDPDYDADLDTIRALLKTNLSVKQEMLRLIFHKPLNIYITNGKRCGCRQQEEFHPLNRLAFLPLVRWNEVKVYFAPKELEFPAHPGMRTCGSAWSSDKDSDIDSAELAQAVKCVADQSSALGNDLLNLRGSSLRTRAVNFKFFFEQLQGGDSVWHLDLVNCMLQRWDWTVADHSGDSPSRPELPHQVYVDISMLDLARLWRGQPTLNQCRHVCLASQHKFLSTPLGWVRGIVWKNRSATTDGKGARIIACVYLRDHDYQHTRDTNP
ncbi:hypothetical protein AYL99_01554 [Fonsecaea erecta]|uniref:Uncharacterized protein n=1 Tax=Fonsecaea erecta TaxID=1367422 RepID=A0A179A0S0_9EURO|nr:hypothetical protein AYL99_01554 [Fonsecaea erecta]OAP65582.1 hypothetical protein AYL99_01554 [Fonsecaea erecta]